jgi:hypothetical protein
MQKAKKGVDQLVIVHPNAAGLDIGAGEIYGCLPPDRDGETVQCFGPFTPDLERLVDWLIANEVDTVAMILLANPRLRRWKEEIEELEFNDEDERGNAVCHSGYVQTTKCQKKRPVSLMQPSKRVARRC